MKEYSDFKVWASECAERGWQGPFSLMGHPLRSYQFIGKAGTEAMWNGEADRGFIFLDWEKKKEKTSENIK